MLAVHYDEICPFRTTDNALAVCWGNTLPERNRTLTFIPRSLVKVDEVSKIIEMPEWLVIKKGLDGYVG